MICNTKSEFLTSLRLALENNGISDRPDILSDFRQHFEDGEAAGESEAEVCRKLGDIDDIIKQYMSDDAEQRASAPDTSGFGADTGSAADSTANNTYNNNVPPQYGNVQNTAAPAQTSNVNAGKIVGVLCMDLFLFSWALPALISLVISLAGVALSFAVSGIVTFFGGIIACFADISGFIVTGFAPISVIFLGILLISLAGMLVIGTIGAVKGIINLFITIINLHARAFAGHNVLEKIGKKHKEAAVI